MDGVNVTRTAQAMLDEIHADTALSLMSAIRYKTAPQGRTHIASLDQHITEYFSATATATSTLNRGDVIELQGPAGSGKTQLLYFWAMMTLLPPELMISCAGIRERVSLDGMDQAVVVCDCDGRWSMRRLKLVMETYIYSRLSTVFDGQRGHFDPPISAVITKALQNLHIFRPNSSLSLAATLATLPSHHATHLPDTEIGALMIDSLSAFYWPNKWRAEESAADRKRRGDTLGPDPHANPLRHVLAAIQHLRVTLGIVTYLTTWGLTLLEDPSAPTPVPANTSMNTDEMQVDPYPVPTPIQGPPYFRSHLPPPYPTALPPFPSSHFFSINISSNNPTTTKPLIPLTHHITLAPPSVPSYPKGTSLRDASQDEERPRLVRDMPIVGWVRSVSIEGPDGGAKSTVLKEGKFEFRIRGDGIIAE